MERFVSTATRRWGQGSGSPDRQRLPTADDRLFRVVLVALVVAISLISKMKYGVLGCWSPKREVGGSSPPCPRWLESPWQRQPRWTNSASDGTPALLKRNSMYQPGGAIREFGGDITSMDCPSTRPDMTKPAYRWFMLKEWVTAPGATRAAEAIEVASRVPMVYGRSYAIELGAEEMNGRGPRKR